MRELLCRAHRRATIDQRCVDCEAEALDATLLIECGVAAARFWAEGVLARVYPSKSLSVAPVTPGRPS